MAKKSESLYDTSEIVLPSWYDLYYIKVETETAVFALKTLCSNQEDGLVRIRKELDDHINRDDFYKSLDEEQQSSYRDQIFGMGDSIHDELERQQRYSMCMSAYSFFEGRLREICYLIEKTFAYKIKVADLSNQQDLILYRNYLEKVFEVDLGPAESFFTPINQQKRTRNVITHQDGWASSEQAKKLVKRDGLSIDKRGEKFKIEIIKPSYIIDLLDKMKKYFDVVFPILERRYDLLKSSKEGTPK